MTCFAVGNLVGLGCDRFDFCGWVGVWCCWECDLGVFVFDLYDSDVFVVSVR